MTDSDDPRPSRMAERYRCLVESFVLGDLSAEQFEADFLALFKNDNDQQIGAESDLLDSLLADVDDYVADTARRVEVGGIDAETLRARARDVYSRLFEARQRDPHSSNQPTGWRRIAPEEAELIRAVASAADAAVGRALTDGLDSVLVRNSSAWILDVRQRNSAKAADLPDGPLPVRAFVPSTAAYRGEVLVWTSNGRLGGLEFAWVTDEPPTRWPRPDELEIVAQPNSGETIEGTELGLTGETVLSVAIDHTVQVRLTGGHIVVIESPYACIFGDRNLSLSPAADTGDGSHPVQRLVGRKVESAHADDAGTLRIDFHDGPRLLVRPDRRYEAWNVSGPNGALTVCTPGGRLAVWSPDDSSKRT
jgi:hypothetical protein